MARRTNPLRVEALEDRAVPAAVGALDPSFGGDGTVTTTFGAAETVAGVAVQPDGKIVVAGTTPGLFAVTRYNPDGSLDATFDGDGKATIDFGFAANDEAASAVVIQDDGKIVVVGTATIGGDQDFVVARLTPAGGLDPAFSGDGKATFNFGGGGTNNDAAFAAATQVIGGARKIVVAGSVDVGGIPGINFGVVRFNDNGTVDTSFNRTAGGTDVARGVAVDAANNIVVVGTTDGFATDDVVVMRFTPAGVFDAGFNGNANRVIDFGAEDAAAGVAIDPAGRVVVAGTLGSASPDFAVARLTPDGALDVGFDGDGKRTRTLGGNDQARAVAIDGFGRIVVAGFSDQGGGSPDNFAVARFNPDGTTDTAFDGDGIAFAQLTGDDEAAGVAIDPNGRIVVAGRATGNQDFGVARLIGSVEKGASVAAGGPLDGGAVVFDPDPAGALPAAPTATVAAFGASTANARTAVGDVNGDGTDDTVLATGPGVPLRVAVVSGADNVTLLVSPFAPFAGSEDFAGGGFVSAGDLDGDGRAEVVVTPDVSGGPRVTVFSRNPDGTLATRANFFGIDDPAFRGGARTAVGDVDGDGTPDLAVAAGFGGGPRAALFDGASLFGTPTRLTADFFAFPGTDAVNLRNGAFVAAGDLDGDGAAELVFGGGPGGAPRVFALSGALVAAGNVGGAQAAPVANFFVAGNAADRGGARVAVADLDGDHRADLIAGTGENRAAGVRAYLGANITGAGEPATFQDITLFGGASLPGGVFVG